MSLAITFGVILLVVCLTPRITALDAAPPTLKFVIAFFRHGSRSPVGYTMQNDPNAEAFEKISGGYPGGLTQIGKRDMYNVGRSLKSRYGTFLGAYRADTMRVTSTMLSRTIMSALSVMAGLFPPSPRILKNLDWQPIPVWVEALDLDMSIFCPKYAELANKGIDFMIKPDPRPENKKLYEVMSKYLQEDVNSISAMTGIHDSLTCAIRNKLPLPDWATLPQTELGNKPIFPDIVNIFNEENLKYSLYYDKNEDMLSLFLVRLLEEIRSTFIRVFFKTRFPGKMWYHSTHDTTIYVMLRGLGLDEPVTVEPGGGLIFEVHQEGFTKVVKMYLYNANTHTLTELISPLCPSPCTVEYFIGRFAPLNQQQYNDKCYGNPNSH